MHELTPDGRKRIEELAQRHGVSADAASTMLRALIAGGGTMAQFNHPELGGMGQWSQGGMIMVGDMFNNALKAKVNGLCTELAAILADQSNWQQRMEERRSGGQSENQHGDDIFGEASLSIPTKGANFASWWGADLGHPSSTGAQNATRYAYFPASRRLAIEVDGTVTFYDTGDHVIGGVSQQQSGDASLTFMSQRGLVRISDLPVVPADADERGSEGPGKTTSAAASSLAETPEMESQSRKTPPMTARLGDAPGPAAATQKSGLVGEAEQSPDVIMLIERLAALRDKNILSEDEFFTKKAELLARL
jgi:hypothetical protein